MKNLSLVHPHVLSPQESVQVGFGLAGDQLRVRFVVESPSLEVNPELDREQSHWGLWDWDVVELFLGFASPTGLPSPYFEFQVSPLGQRFELKVLRPRQEWDQYPGVEWRHGAKILRDAERGQTAQWEAWMEIPLRALPHPTGWDGQPGSIVGGAFAILGAEPQRHYWSLFLPPQEKPDFHLPQHFRPLL